MMRAVVCDEPGRLTLSERPEPTCGAGEARVRIRRVGICGTDYHIFRGTQPYLNYPRVMGHELAAEIVDVSPEAELAPGTMVCIVPYLSCGTCRACRKGHRNCCANLEVLGVHRDGGLTEYLSVPGECLVDATGLTLEQAAMVEFLAIGRHAVERADLEAGDRILVVGAGPIGMAVALFAKQAGADVTVLDGNAMRRSFCIDTLGVTAALGLDGDVDAELAAKNEGEGFDAVFDATGSPQAMEAGFARVAHAGTYVLVSVVSAALSFDDPAFHKREMTLKGSRNATREDFAAVIAAILAGEVPTSAMNTHAATLDDLPDRFAEWMDPATGVIKAIVTV